MQTPRVEWQRPPEWLALPLQAQAQSFEKWRHKKCRRRTHGDKRRKKEIQPSAGWKETSLYNIGSCDMNTELGEEKKRPQKMPESRLNFSRPCLWPRGSRWGSIESLVFPKFYTQLLNLIRTALGFSITHGPIVPASTPSLTCTNNRVLHCTYLTSFPPWSYPLFLLFFLFSFFGFTIFLFSGGQKDPQHNGCRPITWHSIGRTNSSLFSWPHGCWV